MSLRILWVSQDFAPERGGVQTHGVQLVRALAAAGHAVEVVAPRAAGDREHDARMPGPVHRIAVPRDTMPLGCVPAVTRLLARGRFDAVVCGQWNTASGAVIARARDHVATLAIAAHGRELLWQPKLGVAAYDRFRRMIIGRADLVLAVSRFTAGLVAGVGVERSRIAVVPNGTNPAEFDDPLARTRASALRLEHGAPLVVTVARLVARKGIDTVMRAMARLRGPVDARYAVVGSGPDRARLHALAQTLGISSRMIWCEHADDRERTAWLHAGDVFALVARDEGHDVEGFGIVLLEAAACGKPVLAGRAGGMADAVVDGSTGILCASTDVDEVTRRLQSLLDDPVGARAMGTAGRARVERELTWTHAAAEIAERLAVASGHRSVTTSPHCVIAPPHGAPILTNHRAD